MRKLYCDRCGKEERVLRSIDFRIRKHKCSRWYSREVCDICQKTIFDMTSFARDKEEKENG